LLAGGVTLFSRLKQGYGSSAAERDQPLPGDELIPHPHTQTTHAVTIQAAPATIWPWLLQMGYQRGGWYIDAWWDRWLNENFWPRFVPPEARAEHWPSPEHILPQWQGLGIGDTVPDGPPGTAFYTVTALDPFDALVLFSTTHVQYMTPPFLRDTSLAASGDFSWAFVLQEVNGRDTRLLLRMRATAKPSLLRLLNSPLIVMADYAYTRQMLLGIKRRAESQPSALHHSRRGP